MENEKEKTEKRVKKENPQNLRCINCGSRFVYVRIKTGDVVCRKCGFIEKKGECSEKYE